MFPLSSFYDIITANFLKPLNISAFSLPDGIIDFDHTQVRNLATDSSYNCYFYDQEPFYLENFVKILDFSKSQFPDSGSVYPINWRMSFNWPEVNTNSLGTFEHRLDYFNHRLNIVAISEISVEAQSTLTELNLYTWYYFYHGFVALEWFRKIKYLPGNYKFDKVFITFNNMTFGNRNYRLNLIARLLNAKLEKYGHISLNYNKSQLSQEFKDKDRLSVETKKIIFKELFVPEPKLSIDQKDIKGTLSAHDNLSLYTSSFLHVVTETVFYENKLHLTEKIFKPIVAMRPFILVGAVQNLKYLKSYGFKTFDQWIDESYDNEPDPDLRIKKIVAEIEKLCKLSDRQLQTLLDEMQEVLEYNFNWFYNGFKNIIVDELVNNYHKILIQYNAGKDKSFSSYIDYSNFDFDLIKERFKS